MGTLRSQQGVYTAEFAIVAGLVFILLFGVFEIARAFWVKSILTEVTRRGARLAVVCPVQHAAVTKVAVMDIPSGLGVSPVVNNLSSANISVQYLDDTGASTANYPKIDFVRVGITNYQHNLLIPFLPASVTTIQMPAVSTTLPAESLGYIPDINLRRCFGT